MSLLDHVPTFTTPQAASLAEELFGVRAQVLPLPSERDQNFLVAAEDGRRWVLKIANALEERARLEAQNQAMARISAAARLGPEAHPARDGRLIAEARSAGGAVHLVRLVSFIPGIPLGRLRRRPDELLENLGAALGAVDRALAGFDHPALHRDFHWDLAGAPEVITGTRRLIADPELRRIVDDFRARFAETAGLRLAGLRRGVIHNDANDHNVIVEAEGDLFTRRRRVAGLIDFGDMLHSWLAAEPAVAAAYAMLDHPDPLAAAARVVRGFQSAFPLQEAEIETVFELACLRLCLSVCLAERQRRQRPDNPYLDISQAAIRRTLPRLARIVPGLAAAALRHAGGFPASAAVPAVGAWLSARAGRFAPLLGRDLAAEPVTVHDLGVTSPLVESRPGGNDEPALEARLLAARVAAGARTGIGRYLEPRLFYSSAQFITAGEEPRTVHLGLDLFDSPGTPVHAPLAGTVHTAARIDQPLDYGPMLILEHRTGEGVPFYTLYGHLSVESLQNKRPGRPVQAGERIGSIGGAAVNGHWPPHLHFQVIADLLGLGIGFPGVAAPGQREFWASLSPDPNLVAGLPADCFPSPPAETRAAQSLRRARLGHNLRLKYRRPVRIERGWMQYLYDESGRRYLDAYNNVPHVGHCHPKVVEAGRRQMGVLNTNTRYLGDLLGRYAERLGSTLPEELSVCYFLNSASEANELALRLARAFTGRRDMIVLEGAYHGHTTSLIDISPYKHAGPGGAGAPPWVHTAPLADTYRGPYRADDPRAARRYAERVAEIGAELRRRGIGLAGFIAESAPSVGGQIFFPDGYLAEVYRRVRELGGVCIADEVQTGYGRIGTHMYAFAAQGVVPDIVVLGKPIGNGHPIGAVVTRPEIAAAFDNGMEFFSTFGGNSVSCAIGLAVLEVLAEENLPAHALETGRQLLSGLADLQGRFPVIGDVRGSGLFIGVDLVRDRATREPAGSEAGYVVECLRDEGILTGTEGMHDNVIKIRPPLPFNREDAAFFLATLERILEEDFAPGSGQP